MEKTIHSDALLTHDLPLERSRDRVDLMTVAH
jgi:hypothetical protein